MTRQELHTLLDAQYDELESLQHQPTLLAYERQFTHIWTNLGRQVLQANLGYPPANPRKKTLVKVDSALSK